MNKFLITISKVILALALIMLITDCKGPNCLSHKYQSFEKTPTMGMVSLNKKNYYVDAEIRGPIAMIWFRTRKDTVSAEDFPVMKLSVKPVKWEDGVKDICKVVEEIEKDKVLIGCTSSAGAVGCLIGTVMLDGTTAVECEAVWEYGFTEGTALCIDGLKDKMAEILGADTHWAMYQYAKSLQSPNVKVSNVIEKLIGVECKAPAFKESQNHASDPVANRPAPPPPPQRRGPVAGHEFPGHDRPVPEHHDKPAPEHQDKPAPEHHEKPAPEHHEKIVPMFAGGTNNQDSVRMLIAEAISDSDKKRLDEPLLNDTNIVIKITENVLLKYLSEEEIEQEQPYHINQVDGYWIVFGNRKQGVKIFSLILDSWNGQIIRISWD